MIKRLLFFPFDKSDNLGKIVSQNEKSKFQVEKIASSESWPKSVRSSTQKNQNICWRESKVTIFILRVSVIFEKNEKEFQIMH